MREHITHQPQIKRLARSSSGRMVAGVASGLGRYFELNPAVFRLGFVVLTLLGRGDLQVTRLSEEHGVIDGASDLRVGDRVVVVPNHICPVINLADSVCVVEHGAPAGRWDVAARGRVR